MKPAVSRDSPWRREGRLFLSTHDAVSVRLDLDRPTEGIAAVSNARSADRLLGVGLHSAAALKPVECWVRGADVTAVYEPLDPRRLRATATWRSLDPPREPGEAWELVLSAQTSLGESDGALAVESDVAVDELLWQDGAGIWRPATAVSPAPHDTRAVLARRHGPNATSALVTVHPLDARRLQVELRQGRARVRCWLFSAALEKGVLVRGRVLAALGPATNDERWAGTLVAAFAADPPPLSA